MKRAKVVLAQPAPRVPAPAPPLLPSSRAAGHARGGGESYMARAKYQNLLQDYEELRKETEAKKKKLHMENLKKQRLLAEVKFLRRKYKSLSENPSQTVVYRVKSPAFPPTLGPSGWVHDGEHRTVQAIGSSSRGASAPRRLGSAPRKSPVIDLNEACEPSYEEMEQFHGYQESMRTDKMKKYPIDRGVAAGPSNAKMAAFWDVREATARAGKRKISWQDQLALRV